jgi:hypothetical protein
MSNKHITFQPERIGKLAPHSTIHGYKLGADAHKLAKAVDEALDGGGVGELVYLGELFTPCWSDFPDLPQKVIDRLVSWASVQPDRNHLCQGQQWDLRRTQTQFGSLLVDVRIPILDELVDGVQVEKVTTASQSKSSNVWI